MGNTLETRFVFQDADASKVDNLRQKLIETNNVANNFGDANFGKKIASESAQGSEAVKKLGKDVDSLKTKTETLALPRPTISKYWENEATEVKKSVLSINESTASLTGARSNPGKLSLDRIASGIDDDGVSRVKPKINIDYGESKFNTGAKAIKLVGDEASITADKVDKAALKLNRLRGFGAIIRDLGLGINETEINVAITGVNKLNEYLAKNAAAKGAATAATAALTTATAAEGAATTGAATAVEAETAAFTGIGVASLAVFGTVAAAGLAVVKITQNIREEAERRLHVEEKIASAINNQILGQQQALKDLQKARDFAASDDFFSRDLKNDSLEQLKQRRATIEQLIKLTPQTLPVIEDGKFVSKANENYERLQKRLLEFDAQIRTNPYEKNAAAAKAFDERFENFQKNQEKNREYENEAAKKSEADRKKREEDLEKSKEKIKDLGKTYTSVFDNLLQKTNSNNPFVTIFNEGDKAIRDLRENLKGLSPELQAVARSMQQKLNADSLFNARLENDFARFDLKERADELRNFKPAKIEDPNKFFKDFIEAGLKQISASNGGSFTRFNRVSNADGSFGGFSQTDARNDVLKSFDRVSNADGSFGGFSVRNRTFADLTSREKDDFINKDNLSLQDKLSRQFVLAGNRNALNENQQATVDRKIIALSANLRPEQLTARQRDLVATANEKEAARKQAAEAEAARRDIARNGFLEQIAANGKRLTEIAEKDGFKGLEQILRVVTEGDVKAELKPAATSKDTQKAYSGDTYYEQYENR